MSQAEHREIAGDSLAAIEALRADFPALHQQVNGHPLAYLDSAASSQCPLPVIEAVRSHQMNNHANVHRGVHRLSERSTEAYENARNKIQTYINAASIEEIVFTSGTTESINLVASSYGGSALEPGDEIVLTRMEHHSNIVPWQLIAQKTGARLVPVEILDSGELDLEAYAAALSARTKIVAFTHVSNALGTINPVKQMVKLAHAAGAVVLVDGAQAMPHLRVDMQDLGCDFYAFSGHKMFAPTGIGVLYGRKALLDRMPPYKGGGEMILTVSFEKSAYNGLPYKFEAGTPNIVGAIGLGASIDYLSRIDFDALQAHEMRLLKLASEALLEIEGARIIGTAGAKSSVLSFVLESIHAHDLGTIVDSAGVAIRTGHHCAMPVMERFGIAATARASFALYNNEQDIERLMAGLRKAIEIFA